MLSRQTWADQRLGTQLCQACTAGQGWGWKWLLAAQWLRLEGAPRQLAGSGSCHGRHRQAEPPRHHWGGCRQVLAPVLGM